MSACLYICEATPTSSLAFVLCILGFQSVSVPVYCLFGSSSVCLCTVQPSARCLSLWATVSQLSSSVESNLVNPPLLSVVLLQIQAFNVQSDKFASASDCATFLTPAILMGLVTSLILLLVLAYALHMVVHLKHIDRYEEHKATVYFPRSPEAELPDKNSLWVRTARKQKSCEGRNKEKKSGKAKLKRQVIVSSSMGYSFDNNKNKKNFCLFMRKPFKS